MAHPASASVATALGLLLLAPGPGEAQRDLPVEAEGTVLRLEVVKPIFDVGQFHEAHFATTLWDASVLVPVHRAVALFGQLGVTFGQIGGLGWSGTLSNPRIGAVLGRRRSRSASLHTDLPLAREMGGDFATGVGRYTNFEEWGRYGTETWSFGASATTETELAPGSVVGARLDGTLLVPLEDHVQQDASAALTAYGDAPAGEARIWIELSGLALLTQSGLDFGERTTFFGAVSVSLPTRRFAPEAYLRVPLDENLSGIVALVLGARMHIGSTRPTQ